ncbi:unnamed protein product, partial [Closterium sp. NIES-53]
EEDDAEGEAEKRARAQWEEMKRLRTQQQEDQGGCGVVWCGIQVQEFTDEVDTPDYISALSQPHLPPLVSPVRSPRFPLAPIHFHARPAPEFPDEVDTPDDIPARQRFAKYRGLKSFRSSPWDPKESLPPEYARIFSFDNWKRTQKAAEERAAAVDRGEVPGSVGAGTFVRLHIMNVPCFEAERLQHEAANRGLPLVVTGLLQHEVRMTVLHFSVKKADCFAAPIKSKQRLLFHCGFRRFYTRVGGGGGSAPIKSKQRLLFHCGLRRFYSWWVRPTFSTDDINLDKHKFERFLHPGRFAVASIFAPTLFPPLPLLVFADPSAANQHAGDGVGGGSVGGSVVGGSVVGEGEELQLAATGALRGPDPDRIILKKIVLSGYPVSVMKRKAVVRYMFHQPEDGRWFQCHVRWFQVSAMSDGSGSVPCQMVPCQSHVGWDQVSATSDGSRSAHTIHLPLPFPPTCLLINMHRAPRMPSPFTFSPIPLPSPSSLSPFSLSLLSSPCLPPFSPSLPWNIFTKHLGVATVALCTAPNPLPSSHSHVLLPPSLIPGGACTRNTLCTGVPSPRSFRSPHSPLCSSLPSPLPLPSHQPVELVTKNSRRGRIHYERTKHSTQPSFRSPISSLFPLHQVRLDGRIHSKRTMRSNQPSSSHSPLPTLASPLPRPPHQPVELFTKYGRRGRIREPVGTKGAIKCVFDGVVQQRDAVCMALYKRVYPKFPVLPASL